MTPHDPQHFTASLSAKLASRSRHVCLFLGAGVSKACGLPDVKDLQARILKKLQADQCGQLEALLAKGHLEQVLSRLRRMHALLSGTETVDGLTGDDALALDAAVCKAIVDELNGDPADNTPMLHMAAWLCRANYHLPVELFTVNYDLLIERALESVKAPYFDGFIGHLAARFQTEMVEAGPGERDWLPAFFIRLWKLHGSVNWQRSEKDVLRLGRPVASGEAAAIYPSDTKYDEARRVPFVVMHDRLRRALHTPETLLMISGYAFGDDHLNEIIFDAAMRRARSEVVVFCRSSIPASLAERAATTPNLQVVTGAEAIIGGQRRPWDAPDDDVPGIWENSLFTLREFGPLTRYLARSTLNDFGMDSFQSGNDSNHPDSAFS